MLTLKISRPVRLNERFAIPAESVRRLADVVMQGQLERIGRALDVYDQPMQALSNDYRKYKLNKGLKPIRDMKRQGRMLRALDVLEADEGGFVVGFKDDAEARKRARFRQAFDSFFGLSPANAAAFDLELEDVFTEILTDVWEEAA